MKTTTLYENGNTYELTFKLADENINPELSYFTIGSDLFQVISKVKTNEFTVPESMSLDVLKDLDEDTKVSLHYLPYLIKNLNRFDDNYSKELLTVFYGYREHKDFSKMHKDLDKIQPTDGIAFFNRWDLNTRLYFLECIYPATGNNN